MAPLPLIECIFADSCLASHELVTRYRPVARPSVCLSFICRSRIYKLIEFIACVLWCHIWSYMRAPMTTYIPYGTYMLTYMSNMSLYMCHIPYIWGHRSTSHSLAATRLAQTTGRRHTENSVKWRSKITCGISSATARGGPMHAIGHLRSFDDIDLQED